MPQHILMILQHLKDVVRIDVLVQFLFSPGHHLVVVPLVLVASRQARTQAETADAFLLAAGQFHLVEVATDSLGKQSLVFSFDVEEFSKDSDLGDAGVEVKGGVLEDQGDDKLHSTDVAEGRKDVEHSSEVLDFDVVR